MRVGLGTRNPIKIAAAERVLACAWPSVEVVPVAVASGVRAMPLDDQETIQGAVMRACAAKLAVQAKIGVGLEGGLSRRPFGTFTSEWCAIQDAAGNVWWAGGVNLPLPAVIIEKLGYGVELGNIVDELMGMKDIKQGPGTVGILTGGLLDRRRSYEVVIACALAPLMSAELYGHNHRQAILSTT